MWALIHDLYDCHSSKMILLDCQVKVLRALKWLLYFEHHGQEPTMVVRLLQILQEQLAVFHAGEYPAQAQLAQHITEQRLLLEAQTAPLG
jgi:hypothetical protein